MATLNDTFDGSIYPTGYTTLAGTATQSGGDLTQTSGVSVFATVYTGVTFGANQSSTITWKTGSSNGNGGYIRLNTGTFNGYSWLFRSNGDAVIQRVDGGTPTDIRSVTGLTIVDGDVLGCIVSGNTFQLTQNGTNVGLSVTDTTYPTGGVPGIALNDSGNVIHAWSVDDGVAAGTTVNPTGIALTMSRGTPTLTFVNNPTIAPTGFGLLASRGTPTVNTGSNFTATPSGTLLTMSLGTFTTETDTTLIGMSVGAITMSLGTATVSSVSGATQTPAGFGLLASLGTQTVAIISNPTPLPVGFSLGATLGTPTLVSSGPTEMVSGFPLALLLGVPAILGTTSSVRQRAFCPRPGPFGFFS